MNRLKYTIMLRYKMTVLLKYIDCALFYLLYIFPIMLALYSLLSIIGTHYTHIIGGSLFVEVLQQCFAMHALSCDQQITIDSTTTAQFQETVFCHTHHLSNCIKWCRESIGHHWLMQSNPLLLHQGRDFTGFQKPVRFTELT